MQFSEQAIRSNMLPGWRYISLSHMMQIRMMIRDGRHTASGWAILKDAQRTAARDRRRWQAAA